MSLETLKKQLAEKNVSGIYVFTGKEDYLKKFYIGKITDCLGLSKDDAFNFLSADATITGLQIEDYCYSAPVFAPKKLLYISVFDCDEARADINAAFCALEESFPQWCVIIINEQSTENPLGNNFVKCVLDNAKNNTIRVDVPLRTTAELTQWLLRHAQAEGVNMTKQSAEYLLSVTDNSMYNLTGEIGKLFCASDTVDEALIDKMVIKTIDAGVFDLTNAILARNAALAMELFSDLYLKVPDVMIMGTVYSCFTRLYRIALLNRQGLNRNEIASKIGKISPYAVGKNLELLKSISLEDLRRIIARCADVDDSLKRFAKDKRREMEIFILSIINMLKK